MAQTGRSRETCCSTAGSISVQSETTGATRSSLTEPNSASQPKGRCATTATATAEQPGDPPVVADVPPLDQLEPAGRTGLTGGVTRAVPRRSPRNSG
jgi:hypothetical protein